MCISVNDEGWRTATKRLDSSEVNERLGMTAEAVERVLDGRDKPCSEFIAASLKAFPMRFIDLFSVTV